MIPTVEFHVTERMNRFCHWSVLYADMLPIELSTGMLGNKAYQNQNSKSRNDWTASRFKEVHGITEDTWYSFARYLMRNEDATSKVESKAYEIFLEVLEKSENTGFQEQWSETYTRLESYKENFAKVWNPISDHVLSQLSLLSKSQWLQHDIKVHFVDCLYGGFAWHDTIGLATLRDIEVEKKFLAHELSELITPRAILSRKLLAVGLDPEIAHTVVDMLAYFSVRDHVQNYSEKKGVKTNASYYPAVDQLMPLFDEYSKDVSTYQNSDDLAQAIVSRLTGKR